MSPSTETETDSQRDIHDHMGLSYANYLVLPRTLIQSMPEEWQHEFVALLELFDTAFVHVKQAGAYDVIPGEDRYLGDLTDTERAALGWTVERHDGETFYYSPTGDEVAAVDADSYHVLWPAPDPVPHYDRGRTYIQPTEVRRAPVQPLTDDETGEQIVLRRKPQEA